MNKVIKSVLKIFAGIIISILLVLILLYIFIQTDAFNKWALEFTLEKVNASWQEKDNKITADSLTGNILTGLTLHKGAIFTKGDSLLRFDYLDIKYDIWGLLKQEIRLGHVILNSPEINLAKVKNGEDLAWNFTNLFSSSDEKDTSVAEFDWDITVENFKIQNGSMKVFGNINDTMPVWKREFSKLDSFDINSLYVKNFELDLSADYFKNRKNISLKNLSFNTNSDFNIKKLKLDAFINRKDSVTDLSGFELITSRSDMKIGKLKMNRFNPFDSIVYYEFGSKDIAADINIEKFNFDDLKFFIPSLKMLDSIVSLSLQAEGKYGDLFVKDLKLNLPNSLIHLNGNVKNLHNTDSLYFDVAIPELSIDPRDLRLVYTEPLLPDYSNLGIVSGDLKYKGSFNNFYSEYNINSGAGSADGNINLNTEYETYRGIINTRNINIGKILKDNSLNSSINMNAYYSGSKFDIKNISANLIYDIQNSNFAGYDIKRSSGKIQTARQNIFLNIRHLSSMANAVINGSINIANMHNPVYSLKGKVNNLDVSKFTKKRNDKSNLNFSFDVRGRGSDIDNINGKYNFNVGNSYYSSYKIPQTPVEIEINNSRGQSKIKLFTDMLDFNVDGTFTIPTVIKVLQNNIASVQSAVTKQLTPDSVSSIEPPIYVTNNYTDFNLHYSLTVKDSLKLQQILNPFGINFSGNIKGNSSNSHSGFLSDIFLDINNFIYNDTAIILKNVKSDFKFNNEYASIPGINLFSALDFDLKTTGDKIIYENNRIDSVKLDMVLNNSILNMNVRGRQDTLNSLALNGSLNLLDNKISAAFDSVSVVYNQYNITNNKNWLIDYFPEGKINFKQFEIKSKDLVTAISGDYSINGLSDVKVQADNFNPKQVFEILNNKKSSYAINGNMDLLINYKGNFDNPYLNLKINSDDLEYNKSKIGTIDVNVEYKDEVANADILLDNGSKKGNLKITGNMPYKNPFITTDSASSPGFSNNPVDLKLAAKDFQLKYFTKLFPNLPDISGVMNGEITTGGVVSAPELKGSLKVTEGSAFFDLTGMKYKYNVSLSTADSKLNVEKISLSNSDESRHLDIFGSVDFTGLKFNTIDLSTSGDMVLLDKSAQRNKLGVEGYVLGGVAGDPIKISGDLKKLDITGQFLIKEATISSLPTSGSGYNLEDDNFIYVNASPDSAGFVKDSLFLENPEDIYKINPFDKNNYVIAENKDSVSILNLDLNVKTEKNIYVSIDFNNLTRDRLFGEITADLNIKSSGKDINAVGYVDIVKDSYYRFYRNFKISNSNITFNGLITKPVLNIQAVYEGIKTTEQFGNTLNFPVEVKLTLKGQVDSPAVAITLSEDGSVVSGNDAQGDAITYLLFGKYKSELSTSERKTVASSVGTTIGSLYITSFISQTVREILPFLVDAEFNYTDGNVQNTDVELTSEFGDLRVKVGGKLLKEVKNFEFTVDYPLDKLLNLKLPEKLIMEISREQSSNGGTGNTQDVYTTGIKVAYKIKF
ncbi:MAG: hypothetical protein ABI792_03610 [bacterium]